MKAYREIVTASLLMGTQQGVKIAVNILQAKCVAVWLGAAGTGLFGLYSSLFILLQSLFGLGVQNSAVRYIAHAEHVPDSRPHVAREVLTISLTLGGLVTGAGLLLGKWSAARALGDPTKTLDATLIWTAAGLSIFAGGFFAVIQGKRKIRRLTAVHVAASVLGACGSLLLLYHLGIDGVAPTYLFTSVVGLLLAGFAATRGWSTPWFSRHPTHLKEASRALFPLGSAFMMTGLFISATAYIIRRMLVGMEGVEVAGWYQASWTLTTFYSMMILQAMGVDFLPRLTQTTHDQQALNRAVSEQLTVAVLIVIPGLLFSLALSQVILRVLYSAEFLPAVPVARWMLFGMFFRVLGWPLAYIPLAFNRARLAVLTESLFMLFQVCVTWGFISADGFQGVGIAFFLSSLFYLGLQYLISSRPSGYRLGGRPALLASAGALLTSLTWILLRFDPKGAGFPAALLLATISSLACGVALIRITGILGKKGHDD